MVKIILIKVIFYTYCLLRCPVNLSTVGDQLSGETSNIDDEDSGINIRVGRGSWTIDNDRMMTLNDTKYNNTFITNHKYFESEDRIITLTEDNIDIIFEDKKREDAYKRTAPEKSPHSILLGKLYKNPDTISFCTGSLVTRIWVLTAAHCMTDNVSQVYLYAGGNSANELQDAIFSSDHIIPAGSQLEPGTEYRIHPYYTPQSSFDVAIVKSRREFDLTKTVNIIHISDQPWGFKGYKECTFTGFGSVNLDEVHRDDYTRKTQLMNIESPCHCASYLDNLYEAGTYLCSKPMEDYGLCTGDSGGGLICDGKIVGTTVSGIAMTNAETCEIGEKAKIKCGSKDTITLFQDSYSIRDWLRPYVTPPSVDTPENSDMEMQTPATSGQTPATPTPGQGWDINLATCLLTLSMIIIII